MTNRTFEPFDRLGVTLRPGFDLPTGQVSHPSVQPFAFGHRLRKEPEPNALNPATDEKTSRNPQSVENDIMRFL